MLARLVRWVLPAVAVCAACLGAMAPAHAQTGHPAKGSWLGYYGPDESDQRRLRLLLDWEGRALDGVINPGPNAVSVDSAEIDYDTWTMTLEADMPTEDGGMERLVTTGVLSNLGSWRNRRYTGTYTLGDETGEFLLILN